MKKLLLALALFLAPSVSWAQCNGVFPANTLCGNLGASPAPPSAFSASGTVVGPGSSTQNGLVTWANTLGTQLLDGNGTTIPGTYTFSGTLSAVTQAVGDTSTKLATDAFVAAALQQPANVQSGDYTIATTDCPANGGSGTIVETGAFKTITLPAATSFPDGCEITVKNNHASRATVLSGFPANVFSGCNTGCLYPTLSVKVKKVSGSWTYTSIPKKWKPLFGSGVVLNVDPGGSDSNDGLATGASGGLASINTAIKLWNSNIDCSDLGAQPITLDAAGTYSADTATGVNAQYAANCGSKGSAVQITGGGHATYTIQCNGGVNCISVQEPATLILTGVTINTTGNGSTGAFVRQKSTLDLSDVAFNGFPLGNQIFVTTSGALNFTGPIFVTGSAVSFVVCKILSFCGLSSTITVSGSLTFTTFIESLDGSILDASGATWAGAGAGTGTTGTSCAAQTNGIIHTGGLTIPGNSTTCGAGQTATQGQILN